MLASHCPDGMPRWTHDCRNIQLRHWSCSHRAIRVAILSHRMAFGSISKASGATSGVVEKSLACQKNIRWSREGSTSCWLRVSIATFVWPSCGHLVTSCDHRVYFVWSSLASGHIYLPKTIRMKHEAPRRPYDVVRPSQCLRVAIVYWDVRFWL